MGLEQDILGEAYKKLLLSFIASLSLCDHMEAVHEEIIKVLEEANIEIRFETLQELSQALGKMGVRTLYGSSLIETDDDAQV